MIHRLTLAMGYGFLLLDVGGGVSLAGHSGVVSQTPNPSATLFPCHTPAWRNPAWESRPHFPEAKDTEGGIPSP
jgi:hypothetical protein